MSIVGAALGESIFFEKINDYRMVFIPQYWQISFDFQWYRIENGFDGVQYMNGRPFWIDQVFRSQTLRYLRSSDSSLSA